MRVILLLVAVLLPDIYAARARCGVEFCGGALSGVVDAFSEGYAEAGFELVERKVDERGATLRVRLRSSQHRYYYEVEERFHFDASRQATDQCATVDSFRENDQRETAEERNSFIREVWEPAWSNARQIIQRRTKAKGYNHCGEPTP